MRTKSKRKRRTVQTISHPNPNPKSTPSLTLTLTPSPHHLCEDLLEAINLLERRAQVGDDAVVVCQEHVQHLVLRRLVHVQLAQIRARPAIRGWGGGWAGRTACRPRSRSSTRS